MKFRPKAAIFNRNYLELELPLLLLLLLLLELLLDEELLSLSFEEDDEDDEDFELLELFSSSEDSEEDSEEDELDLEDDEDDEDFDFCLDDFLSFELLLFLLGVDDLLEGVVGDEGGFNFGCRIIKLIKFYR
jgi:hypothetical protein